MMLRLIAAASLALCLAAGAASAATVEQVNGKIFVDSGSGFAPSSGGVVKVGDRIKATTGSASINYGGGVVVPVRAGQTVTVSEVFGQSTSNSRRSTFCPFKQADGQDDFLCVAVPLGAAAGAGFIFFGEGGDNNNNNNASP